MGGKREILTDIHNALVAMDVKSDTFCDLFAGTSIVAYAMSDEFDIIVNDIQHYSEIFAKCYMNDYSYVHDIDESVKIIKEKVLHHLQLDVLWKETDTLKYNEDMSYQDVLQYRMKNILMMFLKKLKELLTKLRYPHTHTLRTSSLDYEDCITTLQPGTIIYADPPYSSVHYSRFYHVLETLVRYDNPKVEYKGRYKESRYQSPFDQRTKVKQAFEKLFSRIDQQQCHLLLSYSDNAILPLSELQNLTHNVLGNHYEHTFYSKNYQHMKMGRNDVARLDVHEVLLSFKRI